MEHNPMVAPQNEYAFDYDVMIQAAENWQQQKEKREQSIRLLKEKRYDDVEPKERLGRVFKLQPQQNAGDRNHGCIICSQLLISSCDPTKLFESVNRTFNNVIRV